MNINTMHIGIDIVLRRLNSAVFGKFEHEEKDYLINRTIEDLIRINLLNERNTVFDLATYGDIRSYYEALHPFIKETYVGFVNYPTYGYVEGILPMQTPLTQTTTASLLYNGATYKVITVGTPTPTDLSTFGYLATPILGESFEVVIPDYKGLTSLAYSKGERFIIMNPGNATNALIAMGAKTGLPGEEFEVKVASSPLTTDVNVHLSYIAKKPTWQGGTVLQAVKNLGYFLFIESKSYIACGDYISSGALVKNKIYKVATAGTTNLSTFGSVVQTTVNNVFTCILNGTPTWAGGTQLQEVQLYGNRLVKSQDVPNFLNHAYGTVPSSPISELTNGKIRIYHDNKFTIDGIMLKYINTPIQVDWNNNVDTDMPISIHSKIVDWTAQRAAGISGNPTYQAIANENAKTEQATK